MSDINNKKLVEKQYASSGNLQTRISIHEKYSTNKMGFGNWIFSHYEIADGARVLELGCGTASMWKGQESLIQKCGQLVLSDFSQAMVEAAKETLGWQKDNLEFKIIDIQNIPYEDNSFDLVIANMMLYHVPNLPRALAEVGRVLKPQGKLYTATYGEHGIMEYLAGLLGQFGVEDKASRNFTLQNGEEILKTTFASVEKKI
ncbi:MAG: class I SAM-dependent methyltransferase, partial [Treponema sp.]|nr:class I SAM-dependent methyltransferase [Treponema sp.]